MIIKIARYYEFPNLRQQTPNQSLVWKDYIFTEDDIE